MVRVRPQYQIDCSNPSIASTHLSQTSLSEIWPSHSLLSLWVVLGYCTRCSRILGTSTVDRKYRIPRLISSISAPTRAEILLHSLARPEKPHLHSPCRSYPHD